MSVIGGLALYSAGSVIEGEKKYEFKTTGYLLKWGGIIVGIAGIVKWLVASPSYVHVSEYGVSNATVSVGPSGVFLPGISVTPSGVSIY